MNLKQRLKAAWKGFTLTGGTASGFLSQTMPVAGKRGPSWETSALAACIRFAVDTFPEAPLGVHEETDDGFNWVPKHRGVEVIRRPNEFYAGTNLIAATLLSLIVDGNAYWLKVRNRGSQLAELWYVPHWTIEPRWPLDGSQFISHYERTVNTRIERYAIEDVVHFRRGLDPSNTRKGWCAVKAAMQEILTDEESAVAARSIMKTLGMPGAIVRPKDKDAEITKDQADQVVYRWEQVRGEGRGGILPLSIALDVDMPQYDLEGLAFEKVRGISVERICADVGIDPLALGLPSSNKTYSNYHEAREAAYESFIIPMQRAFSETLNLSVLPEYESEESGREFAFDLSKVRVLQDDEDKKWTRVTTAYTAGLIARRQGQEILGLKEPEEGDVYVQDVTSGLDPDQAALKASMANARARRLALEAAGVPDPTD